MVVLHYNIRGRVFSRRYEVGFKKDCLNSSEVFADHASFRDFCVSEEKNCRRFLILTHKNENDSATSGNSRETLLRAYLGYGMYD